MLIQIPGGNWINAQLVVSIHLGVEYENDKLKCHIVDLRVQGDTKYRFSFKTSEEAEAARCQLAKDVNAGMIEMVVHSKEIE